jgi:hypothetical protein
MSNIVLKSCTIVVEDRELPVYLILLDIYDFDVILGMDWLTTYHAGVDCFNKEVVFEHPHKSKFKFTRTHINSLPQLVSSL